MSTLDGIAVIVGYVFVACVLLACVAACWAIGSYHLDQWQAKRRDVTVARSREIPAALFDAQADFNDPCSDPNRHVRETGCEHCKTVLSESRRMVARLEIADLESCWSLPTYGGAA
jgi:hypothetical protein